MNKKLASRDTEIQELNTKLAVSDAERTRLSSRTSEAEAAAKTMKRDLSTKSQRLELVTMENKVLTEARVALFTLLTY